MYALTQQEIKQPIEPIKKQSCRAVCPECGRPVYVLSGDCYCLCRNSKCNWSCENCYSKP